MKEMYARLGVSEPVYDYGEQILRLLQQRFADIDKNITVAIMGCAVNGPGEAREADLGIAGGDGCGLIFSRGEIIRKVDEDKLLDALHEEILKFGE